MPDDAGVPLPSVPLDRYTPEVLAACEKALRTIVAKVGTWGPRLVLFGGMAPRYIVESIRDQAAQHTGTADLDMVVGVEIEVDDEGGYTKLQEELREAGFAPSDAGSYAWARRIDGVHVVLEFFCPVEPNGQPGRLKRNPGGEAGSSISAIQLTGAEIAGADCTPRTLVGDVLDHGGHREVEVQVVNILPFLVLKAFALAAREKEKDAYDIVWTLNAFGDMGPVSAAEAAARSPVADHVHTTEAIAVLAARFGDFNAQGPSNYARFFLGGDDHAPDERARLRRFAHGTVREFLRRWGELRSG